MTNNEGESVSHLNGLTKHALDAISEYNRVVLQAEHDKMVEEKRTERVNTACFSAVLLAMIFALTVCYSAKRRYDVLDRMQAVSASSVVKQRAPVTREERLPEFSDDEE